MEALNIEIINPKAKKLLLDLEAMNLISIKPKKSLLEILAKLRKNETEMPSLEDITNEVEIVRQARYDKKQNNN
ncbi:MAG: hypothetical protein LBT27_09765 [Prevotellaceae bacterium]|jgi:hypothetical protein|nr:hypothetical protein [Prevotellaceae bacterium]